MHKATFMEGTLQLTITPAGPILIKAGESGGADPTLPDMEFVRSQNRVYIPGSSLKGVVRAQAERIARSLDRPGRDPLRDDPPLADNPLGNSEQYTGLDSMDFNSGRLLGRELNTAVVYRRSALTSQIFGHTALAGRVRFADAYPAAAPELVIEERNGVAIDRIYGAVAVGPFNYEVVVGGSFSTRIDLKNLTLAQLGLLGLALRDLAEGRVGIGFGKSRGLGRVAIEFTRLEMVYPTCEVKGDQVQLISGASVGPASQLHGIGALTAQIGPQEQPAYGAYHFPAGDSAPLPAGMAYTADDLLGLRLTAEGDDQVRAVWRACMPAWKQELGLS